MPLWVFLCSRNVAAPTAADDDDDDEHADEYNFALAALLFIEFRNQLLSYQLAP